MKVGGVGSDNGFDSDAPSIVVQLAGGLGNQLFQYAFGRSLALGSGRRLLIDHISGFLGDRKYRRSYALGSLPIVGAAAGSMRSLCFFGAKVFRRRAALDAGLGVIDCPWGRHFIEARQGLYPELIDQLTTRTVWCEGYWQSPAYFASHADEIARETRASEPSDPRVRELGRLAADTESVAIGVRLFEECPTPQEHVAGLPFFDQAIDTIRDRVRQPLFFLFSTLRDRAARLLPEGIRWCDATSAAGVTSAMDAYWLMSRCRHHVISQSTLYWWAAWAAERQHGSGQCVVVHDQFPNPACIPPRWIRLSHEGCPLAGHVGKTR